MAQEPETKTVEEEVFLDAAALEQITTGVASALEGKVSAGLMAKIDEWHAQEQKKLEDRLDAETKVKQHQDPSDTDTTDVAIGQEAANKAMGDQLIRDGVQSGEFATIVKDDAPMRLFKAVKALSEKRMDEVRKYNHFTSAMRLKAGYANEGTSADGSVLVPDPEFDTTIYNNLPNYGVAFKYANVQNTTRTQVYAISLTQMLQFTSVAEAGAIPGGKLVWERETTALQKYGAIIPATQEVSDDAAIDYWNEVTTELTRAYARKADEIMFTDASYGIFEAGKVTAGGGPINKSISSMTSLAWDDLALSEGLVEDALSTDGYMWFMRRETWARLTTTKASGTGNYFFSGNFVANINQPTTPWGTPIVFTRVMARSADTAISGPLSVVAAYGNPKTYNLWNRIGLEFKMLTEATVKGSDGADFNLATADGMAIRAIIRMLGNLPYGNGQKWVTVGTGTIS